MYIITTLVLMFVDMIVLCMTNVISKSFDGDAIMSFIEYVSTKFKITNIILEDNIGPVDKKCFLH